MVVVVVLLLLLLLLLLRLLLRLLLLLLLARLLVLSRSSAYSQPTNSLLVCPLSLLYWLCLPTKPNQTKPNQVAFAIECVLKTIACKFHPGRFYYDRNHGGMQGWNCFDETIVILSFPLVKVGSFVMVLRLLRLLRVLKLLRALPHLQVRTRTRSLARSLAVCSRRRSIHLSLSSLSLSLSLSLLLQGDRERAHQGHEVHRLHRHHARDRLLRVRHRTF